MIHPSPRDRRRTATRDRLLAAAAEIVGGEGPDALTMARLAEACDLTAGAIYRYFASKDAILDAIEQDAADRWAAEFAEALRAAEAKGLPPRELALARVLGVVEAYRRSILVDRTRAALVARVVGDPRRWLSDEVVAPWVPGLLGLVEVLVAQLRAASMWLSPGDPRERAIVLLSAVQGVLALDKVSRIVPGVVDVERLSGRLAEDLLAGWGADRFALAWIGGRK